jgi:hypothetical protein
MVTVPVPQVARLTATPLVDPQAYNPPPPCTVNSSGKLIDTAAPYALGMMTGPAGTT